MYKSTSDKSHFLCRAGNFSTRGSRRGFVDLGWDSEDDHKEVGAVHWRNIARQQKERLIRERKAIEDTIADGGVNIKTWRKRVNKNKDQLHVIERDPSRLSLLRRHVMLSDELRNIDQQLREVPKGKVKAETYLDAFIRAAEELLDEGQLERIKARANNMLEDRS